MQVNRQRPEDHTRLKNNHLAGGPASAGGPACEHAFSRGPSGRNSFAVLSEAYQGRPEIVVLPIKYTS